MGRCKAPEVPKPDTTFGWLSPVIDTAFDRLMRRVANSFHPAPLNYAEVEASVMEPYHARTIREASQLVTLDKTARSITLSLLMRHNERAYDLAPSVRLTPGDNGMIPWPDYAIQNMAKTNFEQPWYAKLYADAQQWSEAVSRVGFAKYTFNVLDATKMSPKQVRYLMPGIVTLLRYADTAGLVYDVASNLLPSKHTDPCKKNLRTLIDKLGEVDAGAYATAPQQTSINMRQALTITNEIIAAAALMDDVRVPTTLPGQFPIQLWYNKVKVYKVPEIEEVLVLPS